MKKQLIFAFLIIVISSNTAFSQISACFNWTVSGIGYSVVLHDDVALRVSGIAGTEFIVYDYTPAYCDHDFDSWVYSELANSSGVLSSGRLQSNQWEVEGMHGTFNATFRTYCVTTAHGMVDYWSYDDGKIFQNFTDEYTLAYSQNCYTFVACPTNPSVACPTPTPTPNPPTVAITQRTDIIEKNGTKDLKITVTNNSSGTTKLNIRTTNGTGDAVFDNNTAELIINGNVTDQVFKIKGTTESSGVDNITVEAKLNTNTAVADHDEFTVAVVSSLVFEANNSPLDNNPGTDGTHTAEEGQRIFPDKNAPVDPTDRQSVKVKATVLPTALNATVYFATYDLDDPSISTVIDTNGVTGNDNNGTVTTGTSAGLLSGAGCTVTADRADCSTTNGISEALFTVTMQPGDNFAIAASLTQVYRNGIVLDMANGSRLLDAANNELPITRATGNNVIGIRTNMLTTWRRLHIEVDSMGNANSNFVIGTITDTRKVGTGNQTLNLSVTNLEENRFENGRLEIRRNGSVYRSLRVIAATFTTANPPVVITPSNTASSVTIFNNLSTFNVANGDQFILYDDDDMNNTETAGTLHGDDGEDVPMLDRTYLEDSDNPTANHLVPAYMIPKYDVGDNNNSSIFQANVSTDDGIGVRELFDFDQIATEASQEFWTVYLLAGYQYTTDEDDDSESENETLGVTDIQNGVGSIIFRETGGVKECPTPGIFCDLYETQLHELGHLLNANHNEGGLMDDFSLNFSDQSLLAIRMSTHP
jgi:hypothetical protein